MSRLRILLIDCLLAPVHWCAKLYDMYDDYKERGIK